MRLTLKILVLLLVFALSAFGQTAAKDILLPTDADLSEARAQGFEVFKILPREMFDFERNELNVRGGGAFYSFVKKSHSYNEIPQLELEKNDNLSVGFYGANYGFIADLGETPLTGVG